MLWDCGVYIYSAWIVATSVEGRIPPPPDFLTRADTHLPLGHARARSGTLGGGSSSPPPLRVQRPGDRPAQPSGAGDRHAHGNVRRAINRDHQLVTLPLYASWCIRRRKVSRTRSPGTATGHPRATSRGRRAEAASRRMTSDRYYGGRLAGTLKVHAW